MASTGSEILNNARKVLACAEQISSYLEEQRDKTQIASPTSIRIPSDPFYEALRVSLSDTAEDLLLMVNGPLNWLRLFFCSHHDLAAWQVALDFKFFEAVPLDGSASIECIASTIGMDEDRVGRVMRLLASQRVFNEIRPDVFQHTAISALVARDKAINAAISMQADEMFKAASETSACIRMAPKDPNMNNTPFETRHGVPAYQWYKENPGKGTRFALAMEGTTQMDRQITELRDNFPWDSLKNRTVVDVGGGSGHVSIYLASQYPDIDFIVQDVSQDMLAQASKNEKLQCLEGRETFMQHDFYKPQPIRDAGAFFIRQCIHNYNDIDSTRIFRAFVPALEQCAPGTPLLINDTVLPPLGVKSRFEEHSLRQLDMAMLVGYGAKQRTEREFLKLLKDADNRFEISNVHGSGTMGLLEVHLKSE